MPDYGTIKIKESWPQTCLLSFALKAVDDSWSFVKFHPQWICKVDEQQGADLNKTTEPCWPLDSLCSALPA